MCMSVINMLQLCLFFVLIMCITLLYAPPQVHEGMFLGKPIFIVYLKDEDYDSLFMSSYAPNQRSGKEQVRCGGAKRFQYPMNQALYYSARPFVDHANAYRQIPNGQALEVAYKTHRVTVRDWTCDQGMSEGNAFGWCVI